MHCTVVLSTLYMYVSLLRRILGAVSPQLCLAIQAGYTFVILTNCLRLFSDASLLYLPQLRHFQPAFLSLNAPLAQLCSLPKIYSWIAVQLTPWYVALFLTGCVSFRMYFLAFAHSFSIKTTPHLEMASTDNLYSLILTPTPSPPLSLELFLCSSTDRDHPPVHIRDDASLPNTHH